MPALDDDREEAFAHEIAKGASQAVAYVNAGYSAKNSRVAASAANRLLKVKPWINERVGELKAHIRTAGANEKFRGDIETITQMLLEDREFATDCKSASARTSATTALMKLYGLGSETAKLVGDPNQPLVVQKIERVIVDPANPNGPGVSPAA